MAKTSSDKLSEILRLAEEVRKEREGTPRYVTPKELKTLQGSCPLGTEPCDPVEMSRQGLSCPPVEQGTNFKDARDHQCFRKIVIQRHLENLQGSKRLGAVQSKLVQLVKEVAVSQRALRLATYAAALNEIQDLPESLSSTDESNAREYCSSLWNEESEIYPDSPYQEVKGPNGNYACALRPDFVALFALFRAPMSQLIEDGTEFATIMRKFDPDYKSDLWKTPLADFLRNGKYTSGKPAPAQTQERISMALNLLRTIKQVALEMLEGKQSEISALHAEIAQVAKGIADPREVQKAMQEKWAGALGVSAEEAKEMMGEEVSLAPSRVSKKEKVAMQYYWLQVIARTSEEQFRNMVTMYALEQFDMSSGK